MNAHELQTCLMKLPKDAQKGAVACRELLTEAVEALYTRLALYRPKNATLLQLIDRPALAQKLGDSALTAGMHFVRILGMKAQHRQGVSPKEYAAAQQHLRNLATLLRALETGKAAPPVPETEADTRRLYIDLYLREAGWPLAEQRGVVLSGTACIEIPVSGLPVGGGKGFCDYVLYGKDARPLAIVEAKRSMKSPQEGRHQAQLYADAMERRYGYRPVVYYTNGYRTYVIDGERQDREVCGFHSLQDLELMLQRRGRKLTDLKPRADIAGRHYQLTAVRSMAEKLAAGHRRGLLVMATGTGKTRVAISLTELLCRNEAVKRVLFLADRTALVKQAHRNFRRLLEHMPVTMLSERGKKDLQARLVFSTYQTMIHYIDAEDKDFSIGSFDLIIIDEAHRSIFNRYSSIFRYFDSMLVGLTATPKDEMDANTYRLLDCESGIPDYSYGMDEARRDGFLVGYKVQQRKTELMTRGIELRGLREEEREQLEEYLEEEDDETKQEERIPAKQIFRVLYNRETCRLVLEELMTQGLRVDCGETLGRSIIFAYNHKHAEMIVDCFREMYPQYSADMCQLVDNYVRHADDLVEQFAENPAFRIAVSVQMLDTGVDICDVLNLVFFKPVYSKIKFVQMIGRGTRLCPDLFGPGKDKEEFLIFDWCGNFEFFRENPEGRKAQAQPLSLTQQLMGKKLQAVCLLQDARCYREEELLAAEREQGDTPTLSALRERWVREWQQAVQGLKATSRRICVRNVMRTVDRFCRPEAWQALSPADEAELRRQLLPLVESGTLENTAGLAFDCRMLNMVLTMLRGQPAKAAGKTLRQLMCAARALLSEKGAIPAVRAKAKKLQQLTEDYFWQTATPAKIEAMRTELRTLMACLDNKLRREFMIDISDIVIDSDTIADPEPVDIRTYRQRVSDYLREHLNSPAIAKIHALRPITAADLAELEHILWHELGTREEYDELQPSGNAAAFVRSVIWLSKEAEQQQLSRFFCDNSLTASQQDFLREIVEYVRANGDVTRADLVQASPFTQTDFDTIFNGDLRILTDLVDTLHNPVTPSPAA
ncbi:MAG: DEAD/DEAH box helicase family protein [Akkermansia muciniphila]